MAYIVIVAPTRLEAGLWFRDPAGEWRSELARDPATTLDMPGLSLGLSLASLYDRVPLIPFP